MSDAPLRSAPSVYATRNEPAPSPGPRRGARDIPDDIDYRREKARRLARGHSRRVRLLRVVLPLSALVIFLGVAGFSVVKSMIPDSFKLGGIGLSSEGIVMENPTLSGHAGERVYQIHADRAIQHIDDSSLMSLEKITAHITTADGNKVTLTSNKGLYNSKAETLRLDGDIHIVAANGQSADMSSADIDLKTGLASSATPLILRSGQGQIEAGAGTVAQNGTTMVFKGGVKVTMHPAAKGGESVPVKNATSANNAAKQPAPETNP